MPSIIPSLSDQDIVLADANVEVNLVVKLVKCTNSYEGQRAGDLRLEHVFTAQPADRKWRVLHKIPRFM